MAKENPCSHTVGKISSGTHAPFVRIKREVCNYTREPIPD